MSEEDNRTNASFFMNQSFTLIMGNQRHEFKGDLFAKMSKKCASLLEKGITEAAIMRRVEKGTFEAFIAACQLKPFKVTAKNAYELLYLAKEWEISSLEKFANDYINQKDLNPPDSVDYVQALQDRMKNNTLEIDDIRAVAAKINEAMQDDRFISLPPEIIFQTLLSADPHDVDPEILLKFTMNLFEKKPSTGIPLTLLTNFETLSPEQRSKIFTSRKMHEENLNYFIAWTISHLRNTSSASTRELLNRCNFKIAKLSDNIKRAKKTDKMKYNEDHDPELDALIAQIEKQESEIQDLMNEIEKDAEDENNAEERRQASLKANQEAIHEIDQTGQDCAIAVAGTNAQVRTVVKDQISGLRDELDKEIKAVSDDNDEKCTGVLDALNGQVQEQADIITKLLERTKRLEDDIDKTNEEIHDTKCTLTAKIVRDKLRCDEFIRDTDKRFEIFNQSSQKWDLTAAEVEESEQFIEKLEADIAKFCPIRGNANLSPPTSPKLLSPNKKKEEDEKKKAREQIQEEEEEKVIQLDDEEEEEEESASSNLAPLSPPQSP